MNTLWYSLTISPHVVNLMEPPAREALVKRHVEMGVIGLLREATQRGLLLDLTTLQGRIMQHADMPKIMLTANTKETV